MTLDVKRYVRLTHKRRSVPKTEACLNCNLKMLTLINDKHSQILLIFFFKLLIIVYHFLFGNITHV